MSIISSQELQFFYFKYLDDEDLQNITLISKEYKNRVVSYTRHQVINPEISKIFQVIYSPDSTELTNTVSRFRKLAQESPGLNSLKKLWMEAKYEWVKTILEKGFKPCRTLPHVYLENSQINHVINKFIDENSHKKNYSYLFKQISIIYNLDEVVAGRQTPVIKDFYLKQLSYSGFPEKAIDYCCFFETKKELIELILTDLNNNSFKIFFKRGLKRAQNVIDIDELSNNFQALRLENIFITEGLVAFNQLLNHLLEINKDKINIVRTNDTILYLTITLLIRNHWHVIEQSTIENLISRITDKHINDEALHLVVDRFLQNDDAQSAENIIHKMQTELHARRCSWKISKWYSKQNRIVDTVRLATGIDFKDSVRMIQRIIEDLGEKEDFEELFRILCLLKSKGEMERVFIRSPIPIGLLQECLNYLKDSLSDLNLKKPLAVELIQNHFLTFLRNNQFEAPEDIWSALFQRVLHEKSPLMHIFQELIDAGYPKEKAELLEQQLLSLYATKRKIEKAEDSTSFKRRRV